MFTVAFLKRIIQIIQIIFTDPGYVLGNGKNRSKQDPYPTTLSLVEETITQGDTMQWLSTMTREIWDTGWRIEEGFFLGKVMSVMRTDL